MAANSTVNCIPSFDGLPTELILEIFAIAIESEPPQNRGEILRALLLVCGRFHQIVLSNPAFWTTIVISARRAPTLPTFDRLLERAGTLPLDITLNFRVKRTADEVWAMRSRVGMGFKAAHRWRSGHIVLEPEWAYSVLSHFSQAFPKLQTLRISVLRSSNPFLITFPNSPSFVNLRELVLTGLCPPWNMWADLINLEVLDVAGNAEVFYPILPRLVTLLKLHTLCIRNNLAGHSDYLTGYQSPPVLYMSLRHLLLTQFWENRMIESLLSLIHAPLLQDLVVGELCTNTIVPTWSLNSPPSFPSLKRLAVRDMHFFGNITRNVLPHFPNLEHLSMDAAPFSTLLTFLPASLRSQPLAAPFLKSLTTRHVIPSAIRQVIQARGGMIEEVNIAFEDVASWHAQGATRGLKEYKVMERDLMWMCSEVTKVRLYGVKPGQVTVQIDDADEDTRREKAKILEPFCDFEWTPWL